MNYEDIFKDNFKYFREFVLYLKEYKIVIFNLI